MGSKTPKLGLELSTEAEIVDINELNDNFSRLDLQAGTRVCTSTTRPAMPWVGQTIFETDTKISRLWDGASWLMAGANRGGVTDVTFDSNGVGVLTYGGLGFTPTGVTTTAVVSVAYANTVILTIREDGLPNATRVVLRAKLQTNAAYVGTLPVAWVASGG